MPKVIYKYERFISSEKEMEVYNVRDAFLYGQTLMLKREIGRYKIGYRKGDITR